jgi:hypothetical protein
MKMAKRVEKWQKTKDKGIKLSLRIPVLRPLRRAFEGRSNTLQNRVVTRDPGLADILQASSIVHPHSATPPPPIAASLGGPSAAFPSRAETPASFGAFALDRV